MPDATLARLLQPILAYPSCFCIHSTTKSASPSTSLISSNATSRLSGFITGYSNNMPVYHFILPVDVRLHRRNSTIFAISSCLNPSTRIKSSFEVSIRLARKCRSSSSSSGVSVIKAHRCWLATMVAPRQPCAAHSYLCPVYQHPYHGAYA